MTKKETNKHLLLRSLGNKPRKGIIKKCLICDKEFYRKPSSTGGKYCSYKCLGEAKKKPDCKTIKKCMNCEKDFEVYKSYLLLRPATKFCSPKCQGQYVKREANLNKNGSLPTIKTAKKRQIKKTKRNGGVRTTDNLFSEYIRKRDGKCLKCGSIKQLHCSHTIGRTNYNVRFDDDNCITLCYRCHFYWWHKDPLEASEWFHKKWPGRYERILEKNNGPKIKHNYLELRKEIRKKINELE